MLRGSGRLAIILALALGGAGTTPVATAVESDYFLARSEFSSAIFRVEGRIDGSWSDYHYVSFDEWRQLGFEEPVVLEAELLSASWTDHIYWRVDWPPTGGPSTSNETGRLTLEQWRGTGFREPYQDPDFCERLPCSIAKFPSSSELFVQVPLSSEIHKLTFSEWDFMGRPAVDNMQTDGWYKLPWAANIFRIDPSQIGPRDPFYYDTQFGEHRTEKYSYWAAWDFPTPKVVESVRRDRFVKFPESPAIYYDGPAGFFHMSSGQWAAAGYPIPGVHTGPRAFYTW
ncbi:hypothetical protein ACFWGN_10410 [Oerskovia sp. NPDC060338]|uniref:hypothetical protein n=1 Tax=Oerskovia sp. NPDC060338 TaxID=3347100 RepID=UPI00364E526B